jgi:hypothetical protein
MSLSQTFQSFFGMDTADLKSINDRLVANIQTFGDAGGGKQSSLQFHIWKQCIEQREQDEMLFTVLISLFVIALAFFIDVTISNILINMEDAFGASFVNQLHIFMNAETEAKTQFCAESADNFLQMNNLISILNALVIFTCIGYLTAVIQKFTVLRLKDNVQISIGHIALEISIVVVSAIFIIMNSDNPKNELITKTCKEITTLTGE